MRPTQLPYLDRLFTGDGPTNTIPYYHLNNDYSTLIRQLVSEIMLAACISFSSFADTASDSTKNMKQVLRARRHARDCRESTPAPSRACASAPWHSEASTTKPHFHTWNRTMDVSLAAAQSGHLAKSLRMQIPEILPAAYSEQN